MGFRPGSRSWRRCRCANLIVLYYAAMTLAARIGEDSAKGRRPLRRAGRPAVVRAAGSVTVATPGSDDQPTQEFPMAGPGNAPEPKMDAQDLYRGDIYTDRRVGTLRVLTPVNTDGTSTPRAGVRTSGRAQIMTPAARCRSASRSTRRTSARPARIWLKARRSRSRRDDEGTAGDAPPAGVLDRDPRGRRGPALTAGRPAARQDPVP